MSYGISFNYIFKKYKIIISVNMIYTLELMTVDQFY